MIVPTDMPQLNARFGEWLNAMAKGTPTGPTPFDDLSPPSRWPAPAPGRGMPRRTMQNPMTESLMRLMEGG